MESFLIKYGLWAVFFGSAIEADAIPILSGSVSHFGYFAYPLALLASIGGMFVGDCIWYWAGRLFANRIRKTKTFQKRFPTIEKFTDRIGVLQIVLSRVFYGTRNATMLYWGIKQYSFLRFALIDLIGCAIWGTLLVSLGYLLSSSVQLIIGDIKRIEIFLLIIVISVFVLILIKKTLLRPKKRRQNDMSKLVVGVYSTIEEAEDAVGVLRHHGFPIQQVTVIAKDFSDKPDTKITGELKQTTGSLRNWFAENFGWMVSIIDGSAFQDHFHAGKFLLIAHGSEEDGAWADAIISETSHIGAQQFSEEYMPKNPKTL